MIWAWRMPWLRWPYAAKDVVLRRFYHDDEEKVLMKTTVLFPPQWLPFNPHLAPVAIGSMLKANGHENRTIDLNVEFYNTILTGQFLRSSVENAFSDFNRNARSIAGQFRPGTRMTDYPRDLQRKHARYQEILKIYKAGKAPAIVNELDRAIEIIKSRDGFYDLESLDRAFHIARTASDILSGIFYPSRINFPDVVATSYRSMGRIMEECLDRAGNIFYQFYEQKIETIFDNKPDYIGISLGDYSQLVPGLTLAMLLKRQGNGVHINIGGNLFGRYIDTLVHEPGFFETFADTIICDEGEKPVVKLLDHLAGHARIEDVPNLIHKGNGRVIVNETQKPYPVNDLPLSDFSGMPVDDGAYFMPEVIYNIQASRDCYWRKCSFCTHFFGSTFSVKKVDKIIEEIKQIQSLHKARYFHFIDEAMSPAYLNRLSEKILEEKIDIDFYIYGRLEKEFTSGILQKARKAGLRLILWGFESANERIYSLMNKGSLIGKKDRYDILKRAYDAGIWNYLFIMYGFPSETHEEATETAQFLYDNRHILSYSHGSRFVLLDKAPILKDLEKFSITEVKKIRTGFSYAFRYETSRGMTPDQIDDFMKTRDEILRTKDYKYQTSWSREKLFLYLCKYGIEVVSSMRDEVWI